MTLLDQLKGDNTLDTTLTVKIDSGQKREVQRFAKKRKVSVGKITRLALQRIMQEIIEEEKANEK